MVAAVSSICLVSGAWLACAALKRPIYKARFERLGGALMVTGLALLGTGLGVRP